jgi:lysophospholipase L1-like esterase
MKKIFLSLMMVISLIPMANADIRSTVWNGNVLLPLGDSVTVGFGDSDTWGYRNHLQDELGGYNTYKFVGTYSSPSGVTVYNQRHAGISGEKSAEILARVSPAMSMFFPASMTNKTRIVLIHAGTNDVRQLVAKATTVANIHSMLTAVTAVDPNIKVYVAKILPIYEDPGDQADADALNTDIQTDVLAYQTTNPNVHVVDMNYFAENDTFTLCSGNFQTNCMYDTVHPNNAGYQTMAKGWARCIANASAVGCDGN